MRWARAVLPVHPRRGLVVLLGLYCLLGLMFNAAIPPFEAPDESDHFGYIVHLRTVGRLPVQEIGAPPSESHQGPLYYAIAALFAGPFLSADVTVLLQPNPHWGYDLSRPGQPNNLNRFSHGPEASWPYSPAAWVIHWVRLLSLACGAGTVLMAYALVRTVFPESSSLALGAAAWVAFNPQFLFITNVINNDALAIFLGATVFWRLILALRDGLTGRSGAWLGVLLGLALLAKLTTVLLLPLAALMIAYLGWREGWRKVAGPTLRMVFALLITSGWWFLRNQLLYGDLLAYGRWRAVWDARPTPLGWGEQLGLLPEVWRSAWVHFGWGNVVAAPWLYQFLLGVCVWGLVGWLYAGARRHLYLQSVQRAQLLLLALGAILSLLSLLSFQRAATAGSNARYLFVAISAFALFFFVGWSYWFPKKWAGRLALGSLLIGAAFSATVFSVFLRPIYAAPRRLSEDMLPADVRRLDWQLGEHIYLLGYRLSQTRVQPGDELEVTLYWQTDAMLDYNYSVFVHLLGPEQQPWASVDTFPGMGTYPTRAWHPGEVVVDSYHLRVAPEAAGPRAAWLEAGMYDFASGERLMMQDAVGQPLNTPQFVRLGLGQQSAPPPPVQVTLDVDLGAQLRLLGYVTVPQVSDSGVLVASPGDSVSLTLYWRAQARPAHDYARFLHLINERGEIVTQSDDLVGTQDYPTGLWEAGEWAADEIILAVPGGLPAGLYTLLVGLYEPTTFERLTLVNGVDHLQLFGVEVR